MPPLCCAVAIGDAHLGPNARQGDRLRALDTIIEAGLTLGPSLGCWLWPGDIFHTKSTIADRNELAPRLIRMANAAPVIGCRGNHDALGDLALFEKLEATWPIVFFERPTVFRHLLPTGHEITVFALPWPEEGGLASAGVAPGDVPMAARDALNTIFMDAGAQLAQARADGHLTAFIGHCTVVGAVASNGQPQAGLGIEIDAELLARLGDCPKIVNHIHAPQTVAGAVYVGSICRLDFGEKEEKRFLLVDWYDERSWALRSVPLDVTPMVHVEGWLSRTGFRPDEGSEARDSWAGCEVRIRARVHQSERGLIELAREGLLRTYADAARYQLELVVVPDAGLRAPAVATAQTLHDKLTAWAEASNTVLPAAVTTRLQALETSDRETVQAHVRELVDALLEQDAPERQAVAS